MEMYESEVNATVEPPLLPPTDPNEQSSFALLIFGLILVLLSLCFVVCLNIKKWYRQIRQHLNGRRRQSREGRVIEEIPLVREAVVDMGNVPLTTNNNTPPIVLIKGPLKYQESVMEKIVVENRLLPFSDAAEDSGVLRRWEINTEIAGNAPNTEHSNSFATEKIPEKTQSEGLIRMEKEEDNRETTSSA